MNSTIVSTNHRPRTPCGSTGQGKIQESPSRSIPALALHPCASPKAAVEETKVNTPTCTLPIYEPLHHEGELIQEGMLQVLTAPIRQYVKTATCPVLQSKRDEQFMANFHRSQQALSLAIRNRQLHLDSVVKAVQETKEQLLLKHGDNHDCEMAPLLRILQQVSDEGATILKNAALIEQHAQDAVELVANILQGNRPIRLTCESLVFYNLHTDFTTMTQEQVAKALCIDTEQEISNLDNLEALELIRAIRELKIDALCWFQDVIQDAFRVDYLDELEYSLEVLEADVEPIKEALLVIFFRDNVLSAECEWLEKGSFYEIHVADENHNPFGDPFGRHASSRVATVVGGNTSSTSLGTKTPVTSNVKPVSPLPLIATTASQLPFSPASTKFLANAFVASPPFGDVTNVVSLRDDNKLIAQINLDEQEHGLLDLLANLGLE